MERRMRILVGWDVESEIELLLMYLQVEDNQIELVRDSVALVERFVKSPFDVVVFPVTFPDNESAFEAYTRLQQVDPHVPILVAARPGEVYPLSRFIRHGLRSHVYRDPAGEYLFLLQTLLESTVAGKRAEETRILAERLREEIDSVRKLQESIIPKDMKAPTGYRIVARYEPSQIRVAEGNPVVLAGGDYYDAFRLDDDRLILLVGDASGHGMKACMSIMSMHTLITQLQDDFDLLPHQFVSEINRRLCTYELIHGEGGFITLFYGVLDRHRLLWTSAGHCLPLLQDLRTGEIQTVGDTRAHSGPPLAVFEDSEYETVATEIPLRHRLMIYTDGITEAFPDVDSHVEFGISGVCATLRRLQHAAPQEALTGLFDDSFAFTRGAGRHDDTSVLLLDRIE
jgi:serine phosphatase RsbU (regulator of sigma subunit)